MAALTAVPLMIFGVHQPQARGDCAALARLPGVSRAVEADTREHTYCEVSGVLPPRTRYTLKLPVEGWTGRYVQHGCSGLCGTIPELDVPLFGFQCADATDGKLALGATDSGHTGDGPADGRWAADDMRARAEFGLFSEHRLNVFATTVFRAYYGRVPERRYYDGCSTGGRQGLNLAQRFPGDFDGILAGAPAANMSGLALYNAWNARHGALLTADLLPALHDAVLARCADLSRCDFDPATVDGLTPAQVRAVRAIYAGPPHAGVGGAPYGSELDWSGQFVGASYSRDMALSYFRSMAYAGNPPADFDLDDVRFTRAEKARLDVLGDRLYNALDPDLAAFRRHGGKLILYHGLADSSIPPTGTRAYWSSIRNRGDFTRLYLVPGGYHCLIGQNEIVFVEFLQPLMDWVEKGTGPQSLDAPVLSLTDYSLIRQMTIRSGT